MTHSFLSGSTALLLAILGTIGVGCAAPGAVPEGKGETTQHSAPAHSAPADTAGAGASNVQGSIGSCAGFNNALYCGQNFVALGDPNTLYECRDGAFIERERCAAGCIATGTGLNDYCAQ